MVEHFAQPAHQLMLLEQIVGAEVDVPAQPLAQEWHEIAAPKITLPAGPGQFFKGKSTSDLKSDGLRLIVLGKEPDGSRVLYDYKVSLGVGGA